MHKVLMVAAALSLAAGPAAAAGFDCAKASTPQENWICADPHLSDLDGRMSALYGQLLRQSSGGEKKALRDSQRAWLKMRDQTCSFRRMADPTDMVNCLTNLTQSRWETLSVMLNN